MSSIAAVVVTYNRADKLVKVLEHLLAQTRPLDRIIVIDNASTDHTPTVLAPYRDDQRFECLRLAENTGGAGGFATGLERAAAAGADFAWLMDDDCYTHPDALERLVAGHQAAGEALNERIVFAGSLVTWTDGSIAIMNSPKASDDWGDLIARGLPITLTDFNSFVSMLIPMDLVAEHGLPLREYFIWFDDAEYSFRLSRHGRGIVVHDSIVVHDLGDNEGVNVSHVDSKNLWKFRYGARNESSFLWHHSNKFLWLQSVLLSTVRMNRGRVKWRHRLAIYSQILKGLRFNPAPEFLPGVETRSGSGVNARA